MSTEYESAHLGLLNWGRWSRAHDEQLGIAPPPAFANYRARAAWEDGWGEQSAPDALPMPIDERLAVRYEAVIVALPATHKGVIKRAYYLQHAIPELERDAAIRAFVDVWYAEKISP